MATTGKPTAHRTVPSRTRPGKAVTYLAGGNPQIAKAQGDAPVQAYIAAMPGWKGEVGRRLDALVDLHVPHACKAVKWNSPFYGIEGQGWLLSFHVFTHYVKLTFFRVDLGSAPYVASKTYKVWDPVYLWQRPNSCD